MGSRMDRVLKPLRFVVVPLMVLPFGCAGLGKTIEPPRAHIANIRVEEMRGLETVFQVELRVFNTNDVPLTVKGMDCELKINDRPFAVGVSADTRLKSRPLARPLCRSTSTPLFWIC